LPIFLFFIIFFSENDILGLLIGVAGVPTAANIPVVASVPGDVASQNVPVASVVAVDSAGADVIAAIGVP
jgi:hypothetical protein